MFAALARFMATRGFGMFNSDNVDQRNIDVGSGTGGLVWATQTALPLWKALYIVIAACY
jgi:hypothetical protein